MSDRPLKLLLVDQDPIFRLGLRVALEEFSNLQIVSEAQTNTAVLQILAEFAQQDPTSINLVVLELGNNRSINSQQLGLQLCRQLKAQYPNLPVLLLSSLQDQGLLLAAKAIGIDGYCPKGTPVTDLVAIMQTVANGDTYWYGLNDTTEESPPSPNLPTSPSPHRFLTRLLENWRLSGNAQINANLAAITTKLLVPGQSILERAVLAGQQRELLAARWLINHLLTTSTSQSEQINDQTESQGVEQLPPPVENIPSDRTIIPYTPSLLSPRALQATLFTSCINKLQFPLQNITDESLEIDILRSDKKRELLYLILQKIADTLDELRSSQIGIHQLPQIKNAILYELWKEVVTDFFGKFSRVKVGNNQVEIVSVISQTSGVVQTGIMNKIPLFVDLFSYLLFQTDLTINNTNLSAGSFEANQNAEMLLENLLIQVGNAVIQPLLNYLGDIEDIKLNFYDRKFIPTRDIERFRNSLSWKYRVRNLVTEPKAIFESRYELFVFAPRGIAKTSIYAPRRQELEELSGIPLGVTLGLEFNDAIAPPLKSLLSFLGSGVVFLLTKIVGRGLGLVVRGILQGIGSISISEGKNKKN
ncbi:response regulator receiver protein [Fischerella sp. NIES-4106]|nr:response regulator receiver protein [Fischerella sp. NIES-4106]